MKKQSIIWLSVVLLSVASVLMGCKEDQPLEQLKELIPDEVKEVTVTHFIGGKESEYIVEGDELEDLKQWILSLSLVNRTYEEGSTPGDGNGGEIYRFSMGDSYAEFAYVINGKKDCHMLIGDEWYSVSAPVNPEKPISWLP